MKRCPLCGKYSCLHHLEVWGKDKVIVWTIVCEECLNLKNLKSERVG